jgi:hypothetical protein
LNTKVIEYFLMFPWLFARTDTINGLEVMTFQSWPSCRNSVLDRIMHPEKSECLIPIRLQYQETFNTNIVANFLSFITAIHTPQSDKRFRSYDLWKSSVAAGNSGLNRKEQLLDFRIWA